MQTKFHFRVRALICHEGKLLVARAKDKNHTSLPGGHPENGERMIEALRREMIEECGTMIGNEHYLGAIEQSWIENDVRQQEIVHYFSADIADLATHPNIISREEHLEFPWIEPGDFEKENFLPFLLREFIIKYLKGNHSVWWASNIT